MSGPWYCWQNAIPRQVNTKSALFSPLHSARESFPSFFLFFVFMFLVSFTKSLSIIAAYFLVGSSVHEQQRYSQEKIP
jgi:hypothetical protein